MERDKEKSRYMTSVGPVAADNPELVDLEAQDRRLNERKAEDAASRNEARLRQFEKADQQIEEGRQAHHALKLDARLVDQSFQDGEDHANEHKDGEVQNARLLQLGIGLRA